MAMIVCGDLRRGATLVAAVAVVVVVLGVPGGHALPANQTGPVIGVLTQTYGPEVLGGKQGGEIDESRTYIAGACVCVCLRVGVCVCRRIRKRSKRGAGGEEEREGKEKE